MNRVPEVPGVELRPIPGIIGYAAGDNGEIYSFLRRGHGLSGGPKYQTTPRKMTPSPGNQAGDPYVTISWRKRRFIRVAVLVCGAFHGPRPEGTECSHLNGDNMNNRPGNLAWETRKENQARRKEHGTAWIGRKHRQAKLNEEIVKVCRHLYAGGERSASFLARLHGVDASTLCKAIKGRTWSHV